MKKNILALTLIIILFFTNCMMTTDFSKLYSLALNSIANGSKEVALDYSSRLKSIAKGPEQLSVAYMISGYSCYINGNYKEALRDFEKSDDYLLSSESAAGNILTTFMLEHYELVSCQINTLDTFEEGWGFQVNNQSLNKAKLYEICALSTAIIKNKVEFDALKAKVSPEKMQEMEVLFFE